MPDGGDLICRYKQFRSERWFLITNPIHPSGDLRLQVIGFHVVSEIGSPGERLSFRICNG